MSSIPLHLEPILDAIQIRSETSFSFQDDVFALSSATEAEAKLRDLLYERCYMRRIDASQPPPGTDIGDGLLPELRAANTACPRWQNGWKIDAVHNGGWISARRDGLTRTFAPGEFITKEGPGMPLRAGAIVDVYLAVESLNMQPGFYFAFGETVADEADHGNLLRFYWHLDPAGAPLLLHSLSTLLNRFQVPYRFKCLVYPSAYVRADAGVLFVPRRWYQIAARLLRSSRASALSHLRSDPPLFAKPLAAGLAFAEDPGGNQSFGMHRCTALARAMVEVGLARGSLPLAEVEEALGKQGVSPLSPYLNPGSVDTYEFLS